MSVTIDQRQIDSLVARPTESLNVEIKRWINPTEPEGEAKIARAALAMRNRDGGFLIIGFDDKTLQPDAGNQPKDIRATFHIDKVQLIVSRYASELFEIAVGFGERDCVEHPVIVVPKGVRVPVAAKVDLTDVKGKALVRRGEVYFRTLGSNGTVSTAPARSSEDWRDIVEICFENREADIGRFLRRHLGDRATTAFEPQPTLLDRAKALLTNGERQYIASLKRRNLTAEKRDELDTGAWSVALVVDPPRPDAAANKSFLNAFVAANPNYTGWPVWQDSRGFVDRASEPVVVDKSWEALIISDQGWSRYVDFVRLDPKGDFYFRRLFEDDFTPKVARGKELDARLVVLRVAEAIAVGILGVKGVGWVGDGTTLGFGFRWTKLSGRELTSWANPMIGILPGHSAVDDDAEIYVELPLDTPVSAIAPYVEKVVNSLFTVFRGYQISQAAIEDWVKRLIERRL